MPAQQPSIAASLSPARMADATLVATMLQRARPKKLNDPKTFADVFRSWQIKRNSPRKSSNDDKEFQRAESSLLEHFPLQEDQVARFMNICRQLKYRCPIMFFGWVVTIEEIVNLARDRGALVILEQEECFDAVDPNVPKGATLENGIYVFSQPILSTLETGNRLLHIGKEQLGIDTRTDYFDINYVAHGLDDMDPYDEKIMFITIYSNTDLSPGKKPIPSAKEIKQMQQWLGFDDRMPGWWFSQTGLLYY